MAADGQAFEPRYVRSWAAQRRSILSHPARVLPDPLRSYATVRSMDSDRSVCGPSAGAFTGTRNLSLRLVCTAAESRVCANIQADANTASLAFGFGI